MAGLFSQATLERVRAASDIVDVIGASLPLKRAGANFVTLCPFHKEKTPSFNVNPHKQIFHCFGCHKGGDVFTFIQEYESISFGEAVRRLADRAKIPLEFEQRPGQQQERFLKETLLEMHEQITQRWQHALQNEAAGQIAREYLAQRGVSPEATKLFRLGYAPDLWDDTVNWAKTKKYDLPLVEKAGLILSKESGFGYYDRFRGRLMFPICDEQSRVIGFSGRILAGDEKTAKYVNSPETPLFTKGRVIFGLDKSKRALLDAQYAIVCEGQLDLIACYMAGVQNIVAPQGTALTAEHTRILKRYVNEVVLCFDSDLAGQKAAVRALDDLLASGLAIRVATVPEPHDPDSYIKEFGGAAFRQLIDRAEGFFDFYLNRLCATNDVATDKGRMAVVNAISEAVLKTGHAVLADIYAQKTAQRLGVSVQAVRSEFKNKPIPGSRAAGEEEAAPDQDLPPRPAPPEFWLLKLLLLDEEHTEWVAAHLDVEWLQDPAVKRIVSLRLQAHRTHAWTGVAAFLETLTDAPAQSLVSEAVCEQRAISNVEELLKGRPGSPGVLERLREKFIERRLAELTRQAGSPGLSDAEKMRIFQQQNHLRR
ncbi:MAG: DNA primase, partial [Chloroflexi bacterium]|nr:DNA primase [Chloroflexota bacterium]